MFEYVRFQVSVLEPVVPPGAPAERQNAQRPLLCVATTHLYFHPIFGQIRMLQAYICLVHLRRLVKLYEDQVRFNHVLL